MIDLQETEERGFWQILKMFFSQFSSISLLKKQFCISISEFPHADLHWGNPMSQLVNR